ncbi:hypothetical protein ASPACDRAFT_1859570 [Aspergillus aculeatus ATCC 16872]|uniref:FAD/NAD(P)-binding domain-containing protein n=1 Tax=Aspergillus aculeatus (strain ATCC 16872 / CBS 172.66 / WB 5094) TaxID=690307 RepID=A0A1L9WJM9_ASPA1|nr:uncharacterized protein ASPACDRAFT_1859570 [Aspergillus aculeatus ATCC 16872]OJJ96348.1 hypothetical protein ASPACDRAFT_1859570 [Aspergillus aculeatus ATCC 16872]
MTSMLHMKNSAHRRVGCSRPRPRLSWSHIHPIGWKDMNVARRAPIKDTRSLKMGIPLAMRYEETVTAKVQLSQVAQGVNVLAVRGLEPRRMRTNSGERLWAKEGFAPAHGNYQDMMTSPDVNTLFYEFWCDKTRARLTCSLELVEQLAPTHPPFAFGTKRPSLEQHFYKVFNQDNVTLFPLKQNPIARVTATGIQLADGTTIALDALILATGFDAVTGSFTQLNITGTNQNLDLAAEWRVRTRTHLGMVTAGFPNLFFQYGPQSPTAFANGPLISEIQVEWILATMVYMRERGYATVDVKPEMEERWGKVTEEACARTLMGSNETTWYMGGNVSGKKREASGYMGGGCRSIRRI